MFKQGASKMPVEEKMKSPVNAAIDAVVDQHMLNFWLQKLNPLWSVHEALGRIVEKNLVSKDMLAFRIEVNRHFKFGVAGQHHPVYVFVNGVRYERSYSLTQIDAKHVQLNIKNVAEGKVSAYFHQHAKIGDIIEFGRPYGDMTLSETAEPMLLLAAGSGITPMYSLVNQWVHSKNVDSQPMHLMYWVKSTADAAFSRQFAAWAEQFKNFSYQIFYTQQGDARFNAEHLQAYHSLAQSRVYACGPSGFVASVETLCTSAAVIMTEAFSLSALQSDDVGFVRVTLTKSNQVLNIPRGQSILSSLEQQNIKPEHGCRMGICNKCACHKVEGATRNLVNGMQNKEPGNLLRICVNSAQSDLVIDL